MNVRAKKRQLIDYSNWTIVFNTAQSVVEALDIELGHNISLGNLWGGTSSSGGREFRCYGALFRRFRTRTSKTLLRSSHRRANTCRSSRGDCGITGIGDTGGLP